MRSLFLMFGVCLSLLSGCSTGGYRESLPNLDPHADCGLPPAMSGDEIAVAAKKEWWWWSSSKMLVLSEPIRAAWSIHNGPVEYGYVVMFGQVAKEQKEV